MEGTSIDEFFCKNRDKPLKIGSVKSNMGHSEAAATLCSIIKMIIAFESGILPANLHYKTPNSNIKGLHNGHLEVIYQHYHRRRSLHFLENKLNFIIFS